MAPRTSKNSSKKQTRAKKTKRAPRKRKKQSTSKSGMRFLLFILLAASLVALGYYLGQRGFGATSKTVHNASPSHPKAREKKVSSSAEKARKSIPKKEKKAVSAVKKPQKTAPSKQSRKVALAYRCKKPKLVIIIDDVSTAAQLRQIRSLHMPITPSIFPPFKDAMKSHLLARGLKHYMIHLPMESGSRQFNRQYRTLKTSFGKAQMQARMREIRRLFPTARYINNHTGSVFTNDYRAMETLYGVMKQEGFVFIDSRTIGTSKVEKIAHAYGDAYVARDVFIDNTQSVPYIQKQLKKAVKIAKKKGYAIAIGHPHRTTMQALAASGKILDGVELVYIDQIYRHP